jgi:hypothetical protein
MNYLEINGTQYPINFGIGFLKTINRQKQTQVANMDGVKKNIGLLYSVASIMDGDVEELINVILLGNQTEQPRLERKTLEAYIDDPETDIDGLFDTVMDFLSSANACKRVIRELKEQVDEQTTAR